MTTVFGRPTSFSSSLGSAVSRLWVIVLAAGEGESLAAVTRGADGRPIPKQFCSFDGRRSQLQATLARAARLAPPERTLVVVAAAHEPWWRPELLGHPASAILVQPVSRGTAAGVLWPLMRITAVDPNATVVVLPTDHHVQDETSLGRSLRTATAASALEDGVTVLVGFQPDGPDPGYGWVVPAGGWDVVSRVRSFVERPAAREAVRLMESGGLWNSFLLVSGAPRLRRCFRRSLPALIDRFEDGWSALRDDGDRSSSQGLAEVYASIPSSDFSADVLERSVSELRVLSAPSCGWVDIGTPERLANCRELSGPLVERARAHLNAVTGVSPQVGARVQAVGA